MSALLIRDRAADCSERLRRSRAACAVGSGRHWNRRLEDASVENGERNCHPRTRWKIESQRHRKWGGVILVV